MPADADFLRAIVADPDADAPRLAYADWLDECGDAARAEFIRVQCALAALPEADREYHPLTSRQDELLKTHYADWLRPYEDLLEAAVPSSRGWFGRRRSRNVINYDFRRGFVESLHVGTEQFLKCAERLARLTPLRVLTLDPTRGLD